MVSGSENALVSHAGFSYSYEELVERFYREGADKKKKVVPLLKETDVKYKQDLSRVRQLLDDHLSYNENSSQKTVKKKNTYRSTGTLRLRQDFLSSMQHANNAQGITSIAEEEEPGKIINGTVRDRTTSGNVSLNEKMRSIRKNLSSRMALSNVFNVENSGATVEERPNESNADSNGNEVTDIKKYSNVNSQYNRNNANNNNNNNMNNINNNNYNTNNINNKDDDFFELSDPLDQIQYITGFCLLRPEHRDEVYCMLFKGINEGGKKGERGWRLLQLLMSVCMPSQKMLLYLAKFIDEGKQANTEELKETLMRSVKNGPRFQPPSSFEISSLENNQSLYLNVTTMDKSMHTIQAHPCMTSHDVVNDVMQRSQIAQQFGFSLFITMDNKVMSLGWGADKVFDAISRCEQIEREKKIKISSYAKKDGLSSITENISRRFSLKLTNKNENEEKNLAFDSNAEANTDGKSLQVWRLFIRKEVFYPWPDDVLTDPMAAHLCYVQVCRSLMMGECVCDKGFEIAALAARQHFVEFGGEVSEEGMEEVVENFIPSNWLSRTHGSVRDWAKSVVKYYKLLFDVESPPSRDFVKAEMVIVARNKWYKVFSRYFEATRLEGLQFGSHKKVLIGVSSEGVTITSRTNGATLHHAEYYKITSVMGPSSKSNEKTDTDIEILSPTPPPSTTSLPKNISNKTITFLLLDGNMMKLYCSEAEEVASLVQMFHSGLTSRSTWALAKHSRKINGFETVEGDLLKLSKRASEEALKGGKCHCENLSTAQCGYVESKDILVVQTVEEPSDDVLKLFRPPGYNRTRSGASQTRKGMHEGINNNLILINKNSNIDDLCDNISINSNNSIANVSNDGDHGMEDEEEEKVVINTAYESTCV